MLGRALRGGGGPARGRVFDAIQIEVTSRCNLRCVMCPVAVLADRWRPRHLPWELFSRVARAFPHAEFVHLQGWGEPLLHPRLFDMIRVAKHAGSRVGFTTNGTLLGPLAGQRLLDLDLDLLAVSIAGATPPTHGAIRVGSDLSGVLTNLGRFLDLRARRGSRHPKVELFFLMTKTNMAELPAVVDLAASLGVDELVATNLDYVPTPAQDPLKAFASDGLRDGFARVLEEARARAKVAGLPFRPYPLDPEEVAVCEANPVKILFVSSDGKVSPCVYMGLAGQTEIPRASDDRCFRVPRVWFGDIGGQELLEIWETPAYRAFRQQFVARRAAGVVAAVMAAAGAGRTVSEPLPPAPEGCRTCPKLLGL